jgi:uncharacterized membrane protein YhaH (DUF805 family)
MRLGRSTRKKPYWQVFVILVGLFALLCIAFVTGFTGKLLPAIGSGRSTNLVPAFNSNLFAVAFIAATLLMITCGLLLITPKN